MKININFINLVSLGNFNPAILTPDFLNEVCQLELGEPTDQTPPQMPLHKHIKFGNLDIDVSIDRFEVKETGPENIHESGILNIFRSVYEKLPFTRRK